MKPSLPILIITLFSAVTVAIFAWVYFGGLWGSDVSTINNSSPRQKINSATYYLTKTATDGTESFGCGDQVVQHTVSITPTFDTPLEVSLNALFADSQETHPNNLRNAVAESTLQISIINEDADASSVALTGIIKLGGECDGPRLIQQIQSTADHAVGHPVTITINGKALSTIGDLKG